MSIQGEYNEQELFARIAAGDESAFGILFHRWKDRVYGIAYSFTENQYRSEEIVQDVFLQLWKNRVRLNDINTPEAWIYSIARKRSMTAFKMLLRDESFRSAAFDYLPRQESTVTDKLDLKDLNKLTQEALQLVTPQQRQVFELSRLQELEREEVAHRMGISKATVSVHLTIALRTIRAYLGTKLDLSTILFILLQNYF